MSRTSLAEAIYACPCESISRGRADSPHSRPYQGIWGQSEYVNYNAIAIATPKEIIELDIENLVHLPSWYADEVEYDLELMRKPQLRRHPEGGTDDFIVCDTNPTKVGSNDHQSEATTSNITSSTVTSLSTGDSNPSGTHVVRL
ncbi:unnamed protein product [Schistosoma curassoni]|uniref:NAC domain-containing protein n=1 Tax=Schistosoma curassoni TaxID=6186 RepID=A0A183KQD1_9TREM|nr:unnamed protein product [Schistosoma curassoni]